MKTVIFYLGQTAPMAPAAPLLSLDRIFWASVLLIFLITIVSAFLRRLAKDKALKLFDDYHVTFFSEKRPAIWGDLTVYSQGVELLFDHPFTTRRGVVKSSALIYDDEFVPMVALTRSVHALSEPERKKRTRQIHASFKPNVFRRFKRWFRNMLNILRDAISKTMNLVIGRMTGSGAAVMSSQAGDINALTGSFIGLAANAYEPLLERYIGRPVVLEIALPATAGGVVETAEFPGYLVDYSQRFVAVFNVDHVAVETVEVRLLPGKPADPEVTGLTFVMTSEQTTLTCTGRDAFVLRRICCGAETSDLGIALIPGTSIVLAGVKAETTITVERTRQIDLVVPRSRARVRFGAGAVSARDRRRDWLGIAPLLEPREFLQGLMGHHAAEGRRERAAQSESTQTPRPGDTRD